MDALRARFEAEALPHMQAVYNLALRLTLREADARDLVQDTFLRAYQHFNRFEAGTNCRAWLFTIAYSVFVNRYRKQRREAEVIVANRDVDRPQPAADASRARARVEVDVEQALAELPEEFRATIVLVDVEECSYEEAASALGCAVGTIRSRLFRARKHLAARLREHSGAQWSL